MRNALTRVVLILFVALLLGVWLTAAGRTRARGVASGLTTPFAQLWLGFTERLWGSVSTWIGKGPGERWRQAQAELDEQRLAVAEAALLRQQNQDLRAYYGLPPRQGWRVVVADVVSRDPATWNRGFRINRGYHDGLEPGSVVMADAYVIGRVMEVQPGSATVVTVAARGCRLSVVLEGSKSTGLLEGAGVGRWRQPPACVVDFLPRDIEVAPGELVWTSGLGGGVPGGLVVGRVRELAAGAASALEVVQGTHGRAQVEPLASFANLSFVAVYCPEAPSGRPPP